jgi:hypothetical protein
MKKTLSTYDVAGALMADKNAAWSRAGAYALAEHIEELERELGEETELDIVAIRCEFSEYASATLAAREYGNDHSADIHNEDDTEDEEADKKTEAYCLEWLQERTQVIEFDGGIIIQDF